MITKIKRNAERVYVDWQLSNVCNFNCPYCPDGAKNGSSGWPKLQSCKDTVDILSEKGICEFTFSGGELTIWKHLPELFCYIKSKNKHLIHLITNGFKNYKYWNNIQADYISFSWHPTSPLKVEKWTENINKSYAKKKRVYLLCYPLVWDKVISDFTYFKKNLTDVELIELKYVDERARKKITYTAEQLDFISNNSIINFPKPNKTIYTLTFDDGSEGHIPISELLSKGLNKFKNWKCNAGVNNIVLNYNGNVNRTSACRIGDSLGNWHSGFFEFAKEPVICNVDSCWCAPDIWIDKWKQN